MAIEHLIHLSMEEALSRLQPGREPNGSLSSADHASSRDWDLSTGFNAAVELAEGGWREKIPEVERCLSMVQRLVRESWSTQLDVAGECVDIGAYLEGEPECMLNYVVPDTKSVRIIASISARCSADAPRLFNRGIAIAAAVYALQCSGVPVSLAVGEWVSDENSGSNRSIHETLVEVNPFGDYIDAGRLAFWLAHPAALRRCFFRFQEQQPENIRRYYGFLSSGGYGYPLDPPPIENDGVATAFIPFPETTALEDYETPQVAFRTIKKILAKQGIELSVTE